MICSCKDVTVHVGMCSSIILCVCIGMWSHWDVFMLGCIHVGCVHVGMCSCGGVFTWGCDVFQAQEGDSDWAEELVAEEDDSTVEDSVNSFLAQSSPSLLS